MGTLSTSVSVSDAADISVVKTGTVTVTGAHTDRRRLSIGAGGEETVTISADITGGSDPGICIITNADDTNYVQIGFETTKYFLRLSPGTSNLVELDAGITQLFLIANTDTVDVILDIRER